VASNGHATSTGRGRRIQASVSVSPVVTRFQRQQGVDAGCEDPPCRDDRRRVRARRDRGVPLSLAVRGEETLGDR
jgi:hypothetical protein